MKSGWAYDIACPTWRCAAETYGGGVSTENTVAPVSSRNSWSPRSSHRCRQRRSISARSGTGASAPAGLVVMRNLGSDALDWRWRTEQSPLVTGYLRARVRAWRARPRVLANPARTSALEDSRG